MGRIIQKLNPKQDSGVQWHTQAGIITTNLKVMIEFFLHKLSAKKIMTWNCHVDNSAKGRFDMILGRDILRDLALNLKLSDHIIEADSVTFKGYTAPMVDLDTYEFKDLNPGRITPEELFMNAYSEEINESEQVRTSTK